MTVNAEVVTVGDEILFGHIVDTNSAFIGQVLSEAGISLEWITSVGDDFGRIAKAFRTALDRVDAVLVTGGLGPTHDDITKAVFCDLFGLETRLDEKVLEHIRERFRRRGIEMPESNVSQAMIPSGTAVLWNPVGTAPGIHLARAGRHFFLMPGVPREMKQMMSDRVLPVLAGQSGPQVIHHLTLRTAGISESELFERIREISGLDCVASLPKASGIDLRITVRGADGAACRERARGVADRIRECAGPFIYAEGTDPVESILVRELRTRGLTLGAVETCTGGGVARMLTEAPESNQVFRGGLVAQEGADGIARLGLRLGEREAPDTAGSAEDLAEAVSRMLGTDIGLSTVCDFGPEGKAGPALTFYVGIALGGRKTSGRHVFTSDRAGNRERMVQAALTALMRAL